VAELALDWQTVLNIILAAVAVLSLWLNWRVSHASREHLVNEEFRVAFKALTGHEAGLGIEEELATYEKVDDSRVKSLAGKIRDLQRRSRFYRRRS